MVVNKTINFESLSNKLKGDLVSLPKINETKTRYLSEAKSFKL